MKAKVKLHSTSIDRHGEATVTFTEATDARKVFHVPMPKQAALELDEEKTYELSIEAVPS